VNHAFRFLLPVIALLCGCERRPTQAELERDVLRTTFRYFYDHDLPADERADLKVIYVGGLGELDAPNGRPLIEVLYPDLSSNWQIALASTGIPIRPASQAAYTPTEKQPWFYDPKTGERALVFSIHSISLPSRNRATVVTSSAYGLLAGGEHTYKLARVGSVWQVTSSEITAVY
jgi:hypothetical protein